MGLGITVAIILFFAIWIGYVWIIGAFEDGGSFLGAFFRGAVLLGCGFMILGAVNAGVAGSATDIRTASTRTVDLKALGNGSQSDGKLYLTLGTGYGETTTKKIINYISINEDGSFSLSEVDASKATIREVKGEKNPHIVISTKQKFDEGFSKSALSEFETFEFIVPEGTVGNELSVEVNR